MHENPMSIFDSYCLSLLEQSKIVIQNYEPQSNLVCCMNDYREVDGSFRYSDFIHKVKQFQETGDYFYCSFKTFHTLVNVKNVRAMVGISFCWILLKHCVKFKNVLVINIFSFSHNAFYPFTVKCQFFYLHLFC